MRRKRFAIMVNLSARQGKAEATWAGVRSSVLSLLPPDTIEFTYRPPVNLDEKVSQLAIQKGINCFISAGGDGSIHYLVNTILNLKNKVPHFISAGGIGLGSSNDFLKPYGKMLRGIPVRMNPEKAILSDVGKVIFSDKDGKINHLWFVANASLGFTAEANYLFNHPGTTLKFLKQYWPNAAIVWAALTTLLSYRNRPVSLCTEGGKRKLHLSNLAILKNPNVSGNFRYDIDIKPNDGMLGLCYCESMTRFELLKALFDLSRGRFSGMPKRQTHNVERLEVKTSKPEPLETDGEVTLASDITFSVEPAAIHLLGPGYVNMRNIEHQKKVIL